MQRIFNCGNIKDTSLIQIRYCTFRSHPASYPAYSIHSTRHERRSQMQELPTASHSPHHDKKAVSVRTLCPCWSIPRPLTRSTSSHQSSACGLATPTWRPRRTWLRTIELDLQHRDLGLNDVEACTDRSKWCQLVETAVSCQGRAT